MKTLNITKLLFLSIIVSLFACSCSSDEGGGNGGVIEAKVSGVEFKSDLRENTTAIKASLNNNSYLIQISGIEIFPNNDITKNITLVLSDVGLVPKSYDIGGDNGIKIVGRYIEKDKSFPDSLATVWHAPYGEFSTNDKFGNITITHISDINIKGTFFFKAQNKEEGAEADIKQVTEGSFDIDFVQILENKPKK